MENKKEIGVYLLHNQETGQAYVGSGVLRERKNDHFSTLKNNTHKNKKLQEAYNQNPNFDFIGNQTETRDEAFDVEQDIIDSFIKSDLLLNIVPNARYGPPIGRKASEESKEKNRIAHLGKKTSDETKAKLAIAGIGNQRALGNVLSDETKAKISAASKSRSITEETRIKMGLGNKGKIISPETREKLRLINLGNKHSDEAKQKMSDARKGIPKTQEWKDKIKAINANKRLNK